VSSKNWIVIVSVFIIVSVAVLILQYRKSSDWFVEYSIPLKETHRLFDIGVVDANGDNLLDIYTSNHHFRQALLIADGQGGYRDVLSEWGLDQSREFPLAELSFSAPVVDKPGLYIYWFGTAFVIRAHNINETGHSWKGSLRVNNSVNIVNKGSFQVLKKNQVTDVSETVIEFSANTDGKLVMRPGGQGLPIHIQLSGNTPISQVYVGRGKVPPHSTNFSLTMQDRHAMAWADYNDDRMLDIFIPRGALGGRLRVYPEYIKSKVTDEFLVSQGGTRFTNIVSELGISKRDCSGRHARWLDFNQDGILDLFINCYDRKHVEGGYPKQLYKQNTRGQFQDVAMEAGIGIPDQQIRNFAWADVENDGYQDFIAFQDEGFFLYRNSTGRFSQETIHLKSLDGAEKIGQSKGHSWYYDGKMTVADYDADGDPDLFSASRRGNTLRVNEGGELRSC